MFKTNEYFDGKVMSMAIKNAEGDTTIGVMAPGEYEFGTSTVEYMTVTSGKFKVQLAGQTQWNEYAAYETFIVEKDSKFKVIIDEESAYKCVYK